MDLKLRNLYWITGRKSQLSLVNKLLDYKAILKHIWDYGVQLWGSASNSNLEMLERSQSKVLRIITERTVLRAECGDKTRLTSVAGPTRSAKLQCHLLTKARRSSQQPAKPLLQRTNYNHRLKRYYLVDLATTF